MTTTLPTDAVDTESAGTTRSPIRRAVADAAPFAIGLIPFGLAAGGAAAEAGLSTTEAMFGATVILAGAAQLAAVDAIGSAAGYGAVAMVVALINLRFVLYGTAVAKWFADAPMRRRLVLAFPVVDQTFLLCQQRFETEERLGWRERYYVTVTAVLAGSFVGAQFVALMLGDVLPTGAGLHLAAPLAFSGLLAKSVTDRRTVIAAATAGIAFVLVVESAGPLALPVSVAFGVACAARSGGRR